MKYHTVHMAVQTADDFTDEDLERVFAAADMALGVGGVNTLAILVSEADEKTVQMLMDLANQEEADG